MDHSGAVTQAAIDLNEGRPPYAGGAVAKTREDERRMMMTRLDPDRILDDEHMRDLVENVATWAPDSIRQKALRKAGATLLQGKKLYPSELDALLAWVRDPRGR